MAVTDRVISATIDESQNVFSVHACVLLQWKKKSGQVSTCRIGPFPCEADSSVKLVTTLSEILNMNLYCARDQILDSDTLVCF
jgi:hypothetical protein